MSLQIIKAGMLDTLQDRGRHGYQHWGINPGGAMDILSAAVANALTGNSVSEAVIEIHFPASRFLFQEPALVAIAGADFSASISGIPIPQLQPILISKNSLLQFESVKTGARAYLSVHAGFRVKPWLGSCSTNLKIQDIGFLSRALQKGDEIIFNKNSDFSSLLKQKQFMVLPWRAGNNWDDGSADTIFVLPGNEWETLSSVSQAQFTRQSYTVTPQSDRMGYALQSNALSVSVKEELISTAVSFGTLQLLPNGQLMLLGADHQTTGGYPRVAHVIKAHHHKIAQVRVSDVLKFSFTNQQTAENLYITQQRQLQQLQYACSLKLQEIL